MYDPVVGRFLNADPVIQDAGNTQSYNRYSYCLNNPLKYTDPSGMIHSHYWQKNQEDGSTGGTSDGGGGWGYTGPGWGENGWGNNGVYYDWDSGTYRSTNRGNYEVGWNNVYYNLIATGNTYSTLDMGRHDRVYENAYRPNPNGKILLFVTYTDCVIGASGQVGYIRSIEGSGNGNDQSSLPGTEIATIIDASSGFYKEIPRQNYPIISNHYGGVNYKFGKSIGRIGTISNIYGTVDAANNLINDPSSVENWTDAVFTGIGWVPLYGNLSSPLYMCGKDQVQIIQENIINNRNPLQGVYIPATGDVWYGW